MMKLGLNSAILPEYTFEQLIDYAAEVGFACVEVCCWPRGRAQRRYAGVTHIDVDTLDDEKIAYIRDYCQKRSIEISALAYYPNTLDPNPENRSMYIAHIRKLILAARRMGVATVNTFIGRVSHLTLEENLAIYKEVWTPIVALAQEQGVKIAIENCPMLFTQDEWPGGQNLAVSPAVWRRMFELIPSPSLGLNYDPSHMVWQQMDYIKPIYEFRDRIYHVHFKDIRVLKEKLDDAGILAAPLEYMVPKVPGLGDVDWGAYVSALNDIGYRGYACIEIEDKSYESSDADVRLAIRQSYRYLRQFL